MKPSQMMFLLTSVLISNLYSSGQKSSTCSSVELQQEIEAIASSTPGRVGAAVEFPGTGKSISVHGSERFPMQSIYKLPIAMAVLHQVDEGRLHLGQTIRIAKNDYSPVYSPLEQKYPNGGVEFSIQQLLAVSLIESDGGASDALLKLVPPSQVTAYLRSIGIKNMIVATTEKEMLANEQVQYRNWATPDACVHLLDIIQNGNSLSSASRLLLLKWMSQVTTGKHRIRGLLPAGTLVEDKTGTSGTHHGLTRATNDIGLVALPGGGYVAVAVLVSDSPASEDIREMTIAKIALKAWECGAVPSNVPSNR